MPCTLSLPGAIKSVRAPAASRAFLGSVISTCSKPFVTKMATSVVLMANLAGALTIGGILARTSVFSPEIRNVFGAISAETVGLPFGQALLRGIFAGWLLALLVWLLPFAEHARFFVIIALTWMISVCGFTHVVAGSVEAFYLASSGLVSWGGIGPHRSSAHRKHDRRRLAGNRIKPRPSRIVDL
jgi:formate/nitrite transporter FocA (FNT family)